MASRRRWCGRFGLGNGFDSRSYRRIVGCLGSGSFFRAVQQRIERTPRLLWQLGRFGGDGLVDSTFLVYFYGMALVPEFGMEPNYSTLSRFHWVFTKVYPVPGFSRHWGFDSLLDGMGKDSIASPISEIVERGEFAELLVGIWFDQSALFQSSRVFIVGPQDGS